MNFSNYELEEIKNEFPYIEFVWAWTKKFNPFEYEMWGNRKINNFITLTALNESGEMTTKLYKIDKKSNKIIKDMVISKFDSEKNDIDFDIEENVDTNLLKISKFYKSEHNIDWIPDSKTKYFQIIEVDNILRFIYPKNDKVRTMDFYLDANGDIHKSEVISDLTF